MHSTFLRAPAMPAQVFDPAVLEVMFGRAPGVIGAVLETFSDSMLNHLQVLRAATDAQDPATVLAVAHRIKGAAHMSGALALARASEQLEHAIRAAQVGGVSQEMSTAVERQWQGLQHDAAFCRARQIRAND